MDVEEIAKKIENAGGRLYLVGGAVRNNLLGKEAKDEDFCVTGIDKEDFNKLFPNAKLIGKSFEVFELEGKEIALARKERKTGKGHKEFEVVTDRNITIEEDLKRRDITINSIAQDVLSKEIIDPFGGIKDIENKLIKATSICFEEDPLRVYRVARLAASLNFRVDKDTIKMMTKLKEELITLPKERVFEELRKALETDKPSIFFNVLREADVLDVHFKEISDLIGAKQPKQYHPEGDSYNHTMLTLDNSAKLTKDVVIRFSTLAHDFGKGRTPKAFYPHHYNHTKLGIAPLKEFAKRIGIPKEWEKCAETSILEHMRGGNFRVMTPAKKVNFLERVSSSNLGLSGLQIVVYADRCRTKDAEDIKGGTYNFEKLGRKMLKEINGEYIEKNYKIKPGIDFGKKMHEERVKWMRVHEKG